MNNLSDFTDRERDLRHITRWSINPVMFFRSNLWDHARHVAWLVEEINPYAVQVFGSEYDPHKAQLLALVHDDAEIITGDVQAGNKLKMTTSQLQEIEAQEMAAIEKLAVRFPTNLGGYVYKELLIEALHKTSREAQVVMLADKLDAYGEVLHEIYAGNPYFVKSPVTEYGTIVPAYQFYLDYFAHFLKRYPTLTPLFQQKAWFFQQPQPLDFPAIGSKKKTPPAYYPHYNEWRAILLKRDGELEQKRLDTQLEFIEPNLK